MSLPAPASLFHRPASYIERLDRAAMFAVAQPLEVEIGCGDGGFLLQYAALHPEKNFLGVERLSGRIGKLDRKGRRAGRLNLRLMRVEAGYFVGYLLPARSVAAVHIYFPDPWPKKRHHKNRLVQPAFVAELAQALEPGGVVYLRTDDEEYFAQMLEVFGGAGEFAATETPAELKATVTDFERGFNSRGIPTKYAAYRIKAIA